MGAGHGLVVHDQPCSKRCEYWRDEDESSGGCWRAACALRQGVFETRQLAGRRPAGFVQISCQIWPRASEDWMVGRRRRRQLAYVFGSPASRIQGQWELDDTPEMSELDLGEVSAPSCTVIYKYLYTEQSGETVSPTASRPTQWISGGFVSSKSNLDVVPLPNSIQEQLNTCAELPYIVDAVNGGRL